MIFAFSSYAYACMGITVPLTIEIVVINAIVEVAMLITTSCWGFWCVSTSLTRSIPIALVLGVIDAWNFTLMVSASRSERHAGPPFAIPLTHVFISLAFVLIIFSLARFSYGLMIMIIIDVVD